MDEQQEKTWPERPTCHGKVMRYNGEPHAWRATENPNARDDNYRHCAYCGSLHPEDLLVILASHGSLHGSDWKYGYPHKFYVEFPNPRAGETIETSRSYGGDNPPEGTPTYGPAWHTLHAKFYTDHLLDEGYSEAALTAILAALTQYSGIAWTRDAAGEVAYVSPCHGFQR